MENKKQEIEALKKQVRKLEKEIEQEKKESDFKDVSVCNKGYYSIRGGACRYADVYHGEVYCKHPNCTK